MVPVWVFSTLVATCKATLNDEMSSSVVEMHTSPPDPPSISRHWIHQYIWMATPFMTTNTGIRICRSFVIVEMVCFERACKLRPCKYSMLLAALYQKSFKLLWSHLADHSQTVRTFDHHMISRKPVNLSLVAFSCLLTALVCVKCLALKDFTQNLV